VADLYRLAAERLGWTAAEWAEDHSAATHLRSPVTLAWVEMKPPVPVEAFVYVGDGCFWHRFGDWCLAAFRVGHCIPEELAAGPVMPSGVGGWRLGEEGPSGPPLTPILPVPLDEPGPRPEPRQWKYPFADPCKGELRLPFAAPPQAGTGMGDYAGDGWKPLGITGYEVRVFIPPIPGASPDPVLQYRPREEGGSG